MGCNHSNQRCACCFRHQQQPHLAVMQNGRCRDSRRQALRCCACWQRSARTPGARWLWACAHLCCRALAPLQLGLNPVPCVAEHPVSEGIFNFVNAWSLMFWPVMLADPRGTRVKNKLPLWVGTQVREAGRRMVCGWAAGKRQAGLPSLSWR